MNNDSDNTQLMNDQYYSKIDLVIYFILGILVCAVLVVGGWILYKRTSNPLLRGWRIPEQELSNESYGGDIPISLNFSNDSVAITTISGEVFTSSYELNPANTEFEKSITIHDYIGKKGCDVTIDWGIQQHAYIHYDNPGESHKLDLHQGDDVENPTVLYNFCG